MLTVSAFYHFTRFNNPAAIKPGLLAFCEENAIKGTILLAKEGLNGTIAAEASAIEAVISYLRELPGCGQLEEKRSQASSMPFNRMKVRLKKEIVSMGVEAIDPANLAGSYVSPQDWNALISDPDIILVDTRNDYEVQIGSFNGAINPQTDNFRQFPAWADEQLLEAARKGKKLPCFALVVFAAKNQRLIYARRVPKRFIISKAAS